MMYCDIICPKISITCERLDKLNLHGMYSTRYDGLI